MFIFVIINKCHFVQCEQQPADEEEEEEEVVQQEMEAVIVEEDVDEEEVATFRTKVCAYKDKMQI